ncbi:dGTPase [Nitrincola iocasae]|uniref:Probable deoxyguanosinetriphosphate triphosphohydrolase n=1 Tax=Nitrincola iocasae TaxID=2614693 RepID=A0A5J6LCZ0_9GAMM|nr:dGTPase [Nitrincola iocasae]QEW06465.1 dGTPase [Nitrincola iocasae]
MTLINFAKRFSSRRPYSKASASPQLDAQLESDRGRIINSAAVRRLQQKTQVFPLEHNAAVRSRLTHSLEVQQTGRFITRTLFDKLGAEASRYGLAGSERATESLVEMACLMHDIGNPPFGHFGEAAISRWFTEQIDQFPGFIAPSSSAEGQALTQKLKRELCSFEGNAQAIRLISQLQKLNLTYLQSACILKYTRCATDPRPDAQHPLSYLMKKPGYYFSERQFVAEMQETLEMRPGHRFPLTYLMEAADDISYCLADLEDAIDKGILSIRQLAQLLIEQFARLRPLDADEKHFYAPGRRSASSFTDLVHYALERADKESINKDHEFFVWLRVGLTHPLVQHAAQAFIDNIEAVYQGRLNRALLEDDSPCHAIVSTLKKVAIRHVFSVDEVKTLELQGYRILTGLLDHYRPLLRLSRSQFGQLLEGKNQGLLLEGLLVRRLPNKHIKAYYQLYQQSVGDVDVWESYCRCRLLQDMISGMTDQYALDEFKTLSVI